jgi:hypothetical protein
MVSFAASVDGLQSRIHCAGGVCGHARGLVLQLSQGQGRQPLAPEGAPLAAGVRLVRPSQVRV